MLKTVFEIILLVVSVLTIVVCLLQPSKSDGASGAITGGMKMNIFARTKERGVDKILSIITYILLGCFFVSAIFTMFL